MKHTKSLLVISCFFLSFSISAQEKSYKTKELRHQFYSELVTKFGSEDIKTIFESDKTFKFEEWVDEQTESGLLDDYNVVIHELFHGLSSDKNQGQDLFLDKNKIVFIPHSKVFNSKELNADFSKGMQDSIMRYGIYVGGVNKLPDGQTVPLINQKGRNEVGSIQKGIYGLFEEFTAYYYGAKASYQLYDYYFKNCSKKKDKRWGDYIDNVKSDLMAFYEFKIFISYYLKHAKTKHKAVYKGIVENQNFKTAYTLINLRFEKLISDFKLKETEINKYNSPNIMEALDFSGSDEDIYKFLKLSGAEADALFYIKEGKYQWKGDQAMYKEIKSGYNQICKQIQSDVKSGILMFYYSRTAYLNYLIKESDKVKEELKAISVEGLNEENYGSYFK